MVDNVGGGGVGGNSERCLKWGDTGPLRNLSQTILK